MITEQQARKELSLDMDVLELLMLMSEGNPGAVSVLAKLIEEELGLIKIFELDDMNIRGTQIWIGYKEYCGQDIEKFKECISRRDEKMIDCINEEGRRGNHPHKAVFFGASMKNGRRML